MMPHMKINSRQTKDLNVQGKIIKLLEDTRGYLYNRGLGEGFLNNTQNTPQTIQTKIDQLNYIKTENLSSSKFTTKSESTCQYL